MIVNVISSLLLFCVGIGAGYQVANLGTIQSMRERKAIKNFFNCASNDFTYFYEDVDDFYIVSLKSEEYRVKFSLSRPTQIVYSVKLESN
ncbi:MULTISPECIES: hypothetical protein [Lactobacillales]|jgi:hypothetical protein|uniref:hypothetical protein n=1 Tax=Lactobacillales TaxID=186826 RepID=UPI0005559B2E|nr:MULTISPECIES: hypothetical protein [Carnobacterium]AOA04216.1 hypothetical protein BFC23_16245 [Carnobacterium maltaromaticum]MBC9788186.1 hypothetical protein [Carnobacterium maltaromaticum]MBQ6485277.1 hypothetical protein [Carnobacterium sp.]MDT1946565.1 hypothetical protein [Carnobacterium maltaromaticum]MDT2000950.1 hypothetical protein [Carnobacterium maltaromaticum]